MKKFLYAALIMAMAATGYAAPGDRTPVTGTKIVVSDTPPATPTAGQIWIDTSAPASAGVPVYPGDPANPTTGTIWYNSTAGEWRGKTSSGNIKLTGVSLDGGTTGTGTPTSTAIPNMSGTESSSFSANVASYFSDPGGQTLSFTATGLPAGLSINSSTGAITGTLPAVSVNTDYSVTVKATDTEQLYAYRGFTLTVLDAGGGGGTSGAGFLVGDNTDYTTTGQARGVAVNKLVCIRRAATWTDSATTKTVSTGKIAIKNAWNSTIKMALYSWAAYPGVKNLLGYTNEIKPATNGTPQIFTLNFTSQPTITKGSYYWVCVMGDNTTMDVYTASASGSEVIDFTATDIWSLNIGDNHQPPPTVSPIPNDPGYYNGSSYPYQGMQMWLEN